METETATFRLSREEYAIDKLVSAMEDIQRLKRELTTARQRAAAYTNELKRLRSQ